MSISINTQFIYHLISYHLGPIVQSTSTTSPHLSTTSGLGICNLRCWANEKNNSRILGFLKCLVLKNGWTSFPRSFRIQQRVGVLRISGKNQFNDRYFQVRLRKSTSDQSVSISRTTKWRMFHSDVSLPKVGNDCHLLLELFCIYVSLWYFHVCGWIGWFILQQPGTWTCLRNVRPFERKTSPWSYWK